MFKLPGLSMRIEEIRASAPAVTPAFGATSRENDRLLLQRDNNIDRSISHLCEVNQLTAGSKTEQPLAADFGLGFFFSLGGNFDARKLTVSCSYATVDNES